jgi:hypothetical protein
MKDTNQQELISKYLTSRGVVGFQFSGGRSGVTGPEINIDGCTSEMFHKLHNACADALIARGGGGMAGSHAYRQINPSAFSDPKDRAGDLLELFEATRELPPKAFLDLEIYFDAESNLIAQSGEVVYAADSRTKAMHSWAVANHWMLMEQETNNEKITEKSQ